MNNDIIKLLNLEDDCVINSINIAANQTKTIPLSKLPSEKYCPICNFRMHSKCFKKREKHLHITFQLIPHKVNLGFNIFSHILIREHI